jgi:hypothetical protein
MDHWNLNDALYKCYLPSFHRRGNHPFHLTSMSSSSATKDPRYMIVQANAGRGTSKPSMTSFNISASVRARSGWIQP